MELVLHEAQCHQGVHIEQVDHGKLANISRTWRVLRTGAPEPAVRAGSPVASSITTLALRRRGARGSEPRFPLRFWHRADRRDECQACGAGGPGSQPVL